MTAVRRKKESQLQATRRGAKKIKNHAHVSIARRVLVPDGRNHKKKTPLIKIMGSDEVRACPPLLTPRRCARKPPSRASDEAHGGRKKKKKKTERHPTLPLPTFLFPLFHDIHLSHSLSLSFASPPFPSPLPGCDGPRACPRRPRGANGGARKLAVIQRTSRKCFRRRLPHSRMKRG